MSEEPEASQRRQWAGLYAAIPTFFTDSGALDDHSMNLFLEWLGEHDGVDGVVAHAHGGEINNLTIDEAVSVTQSVVKGVGADMRVVSGLMAEGIEPGLEIARRLEDAGTHGLLVMPPHSWLRFGKSLEESLGYVEGISSGTATALIIHEYPWTTNARYTTDELVAFSKVDNVVGVKSGTRNMAAYMDHIIRLREEAPDFAILTCHDEAMLPTLAPGIDGALVSLASIIPEELAAMIDAIARNDLNRALEINSQVWPLIDLFYGGGDPLPRSHALMKGVLHRLGVVPNMVVRPPIPPISTSEISRIDAAIEATGLDRWRR